MQKLLIVNHGFSKRFWTSFLSGSCIYCALVGTLGNSKSDMKRHWWLLLSYSTVISKKVDWMSLCEALYLYFFTVFISLQRPTRFPALRSQSLEFASLLSLLNMNLWHKWSYGALERIMVTTLFGQGEDVMRENETEVTNSTWQRSDLGVKSREAQERFICNTWSAGSGLFDELQRRMCVFVGMVLQRQCPTLQVWETCGQVEVKNWIWVLYWVPLL